MLGKVLKGEAVSIDGRLLKPFSFFSTSTDIFPAGYNFVGEVLSPGGIKQIPKVEIIENTELLF